MHSPQTSPRRSIFEQFLRVNPSKNPQPQQATSSLLAGLGAAILAGTAFFAAPEEAQARQSLVCGPEYSTVEALRTRMEATQPSLIALSAEETDRYLHLLGKGRPADSSGRASLIVISPHGGAVLGMTDGANMCSPILRITQSDHQEAIDQVMGVAI